MAGGEAVPGKCGLGSDCGGRACHRAAQTSTGCKNELQEGRGLGQRDLRNSMLQAHGQVGAAADGPATSKLLPSSTGKPPKPSGGPWEPWDSQVSRLCPWKRAGSGTGWSRGRMSDEPGSEARDWGAGHLTLSALLSQNRSSELRVGQGPSWLSQARPGKPLPGTHTHTPAGRTSRKKRGRREREGRERMSVTGGPGCVRELEG